MGQNHGAEHIEGHENCRVQRHQAYQTLQQKELVRHKGSSIEPQVEGAKCADQQNCSADY